MRKYIKQKFADAYSVAFTLRGKVITESGQPIEDVRVQLYDHDDNERLKPNSYATLELYSFVVPVARIHNRVSCPAC